MFKGHHKIKFEKDHNKLNDLFNTYSNLKDKNQGGYKEAFQVFANTLHSHMLWEEKVLFPILERKLGAHYIEITKDIKEDHVQLLNYLKLINKKIQNDETNTEGDEHKLMTLLLKHETKEEKILHPEIIKHLSQEEIKGALEEMNNISSDIFGYPFYGGEHTKLIKLFNDYKVSKKNNPEKVKEALNVFSTSFEKHIMWGEKTLFRILSKDKNGSHDQTIDLLRSQHIKILAYLKNLCDKIENNLNAIEEEDKLFACLVQHEEYEDEVLHPIIIRLMKEEGREDIFSLINDGLEKYYKEKR